MTEVSIEPFAQAHLDGLIALVTAEGWTEYTDDVERTYRALTAPGVMTLVATVGGRGCRHGPGPVRWAHSGPRFDAADRPGLARSRARLPAPARGPQARGRAATRHTRSDRGLHGREGASSAERSRRLLLAQSRRLTRPVLDPQQRVRACVMSRQNVASLGRRARARVSSGRVWSHLRSVGCQTS